MPIDDEEERYRYKNVLDELGRIWRSVEEFKAEQSATSLEYWKATAAAIRGLSDWQASDAKLAQTERETYRKLWNRLHWISIGLSVTLLIVVIIAVVYLIGRSQGG
jgi:uncharacterized membrane protein YukC